MTTTTTRDGRPADVTLETGRLGPAAGPVLVIRDHVTRTVLLACPAAHVSRAVLATVVGDNAARVMTLVAD